MSKIIVSWKSGWIDNLVPALKGDDHARLARTQHAAERGYEVWRTWVDLHQGTVLQDSDVNGFYQLPTDSIADLHQVIETYKQLVKEPLSVGIGKFLLEAEQARKLSEKTERQVVFFSEDTLNESSGESNGSLLEAFRDITKNEQLEKAFNVKRFLASLATVGLLGGLAHVGAEKAVEEYKQRLTENAVKPEDLDYVRFVKQWQPSSLSHFKVPSKIWTRLDPLLQHAAYRESAYNKLKSHPDIVNKPVGIVGLTPLATIDAIQTNPDGYRSRHGHLVSLVHDNRGNPIPMGELEKSDPARWRSILDRVVTHIKGDDELYLQAANDYIGILRKERGGSDLMAGLAWNGGRYNVPNQVTPEVAREALKQQYAINLMSDKKEEHIKQWPSVKQHMLTGLHTLFRVDPDIATDTARQFEMDKKFGQHRIGEKVIIPYKPHDDEAVRGNFKKLKSMAVKQRKFVGPQMPDPDVINAQLEDAHKSEDTIDQQKEYSNRIVGGLNEAISNRPAEAHDEKALKRQLMQVIKQVKQYAPVLDQIKENNPKLHATVANMVQVMTTMAQKLDLTKAEQEEVDELTKKARVLPKVFPVGSKLSGAAGGPDMPAGRVHTFEQTQQGDEQGELRSMRSGMIRNPEQPSGSPVSSRANPNSYVPKGRQRS